jgi:hypothetical protein
VLKKMGNTEGALAAFKEIISKHSKGKRVTEAKNHVTELGKKAR